MVHRSPGGIFFSLIWKCACTCTVNVALWVLLDAACLISHHNLICIGQRPTLSVLFLCSRFLVLTIIEDHRSMNYMRQNLSLKARRLFVSTCNFFKIWPLCLCLCWIVSTKKHTLSLMGNISLLGDFCLVVIFVVVFGAVWSKEVISYRDIYLMLDSFPPWKHQCFTYHMGWLLP